MNTPFNALELEDALKTLKDKKSPGPDKITNEMLKHMGAKAKSKLIGLYSNSWKEGIVPQKWREAVMVPIYKKGKERSKTTSYRPISLTSCVGKLMERLINSRLVWHLEKRNILIPKQAGFRHHRSTEDQVAYIAQHIEDGFQDKRHTLAVWVDMEKAFDRAWKDGLRLKLHKSGISGCMYEWISQYLNNRTARAQVNGAHSRQKTLREGVPQGGVLSPTVFLIYVNHIIAELPRKIHSALYADDMVLWCTKDEDNPTYLEVTFDKRLTWKQHTLRTESRAKVRLALMKKLASTTCDADASTLRRLYTSRVRPVLEYGMAALGTTAKINMDKMSKVQNQAARVITGSMRSTPIQELETITGLQPLLDRCHEKLLTQAAKFKRRSGHPMEKRMYQPTRGRLKRENFVHQSRCLEQRHRDILEQNPQKISQCPKIPAWSKERHFLE
ncbi:hypothetical protein RRG08_006757 [Elysia crispata]|uniref:Reverse transcriptase domain-containing protein n=1 Tax=Elysia crispata TaxID=231223 RepID=A0AAE0ZPF6_9GAST|nr:hypothetical protein RRG08_006757 [Elysia crispata]